MTILTIYADLTPGQELRGVQADDAGGSRANRVWRVVVRRRPEQLRVHLDHERRGDPRRGGEGRHEVISINNTKYSRNRI